MESLAELREVREKVNKDAEEITEKPQIIIGFSTCGIAAGAREVLSAVQDEVEDQDLDLTITQTGCIGLCEKEPLLDVKLPGEDRVTYGNIDVDDISKIINEHIIDGKIVEDLAIAKLEE